MSQKYQLQGNDITREGVKIATRDPATGTIDYLPDCDRYRAPVSGWLAEQGLAKPPVTPPEVAARQAKPKFVGSPAAAPDTPPEPETSTSNAGDQPDAKDAEIAALKAKLAQLEGKPAQAAVPAKTVSPDVVMPPPVDPTKPANLREIDEAKRLQRVFESFYAEGCPKMGPAGTKTPDFVNWVCRHKPDFARNLWSTAQLPGNKAVDMVISEQAAK